MTSESEPLWPYLFLAVGWSAACAYMLIRARTSRKSTAPLDVPDTPLASTSTHAPWERDTQAGRM